MGDLKVLQEELLSQYYSVKEWVEMPETKNYFNYLKTTKQAFLEKLATETNIEKIRWYQGIIQVLSLALIYTDEAMAAGELTERQNYIRSE